MTKVTSQALYKKNIETKEKKKKINESSDENGRLRERIKKVSEERTDQPDARLHPDCC